MRKLLVLLSACTVALSLCAADPYVGYVYPASVQAGTTNRLVIGGQFWRADSVRVSGGGVKVLDFEIVPSFPVPTGDQRAYLIKWLDGIAEGRALQPRLPIGSIYYSDWRKNKWFDILGDLDTFHRSFVERSLFLPRNPLQMSPSLSQRAIVTVAVDADAAPGPHELRVLTPWGMSPPRPLVVTRIPHQREPLFVPAHRPQPEKPVVAKIPCALDGQIEPGQSDTWILPQLKKGRVLTFRTQAREFQPYVGDAVPGFFNAVLRMVGPNGREVAFADDYFYHPDPVLAFTVPMDGDYRLEIHDNLYRGRLDFVYSIQVLEGVQLPGMRQLSLWKNPSYDIPVKALVKEAWGALKRPGQKGVHEFAVKAAGEELVFDVLARRAGSPIDARVQIVDAAGKTLATFSDVTNTVHVGTVIQAECDPVGRVRFAKPGTYRAIVTDEAGKGGWAYAYHLRIHHPAPRFEVWANRSGAVVRPWEGVSTKFAVIRKDGFAGDVRILSNSVFRIDTPVIPAASNEVTIVLRARREPPIGFTNVTLNAVAQIGGRTVCVPVNFGNLYNQAFAWDHYVPARHFLFKGIPPLPTKRWANPNRPRKPGTRPTAKPGANRPRKGMNRSKPNDKMTKLKLVSMVSGSIAGKSDAFDPGDYKQTVETRLVPSEIRTPIRGRTLVDFGRESFGYLEFIPPKGARGAYEVRLGELLRPDGSVDMHPGATIRAVRIVGKIERDGVHRVPLPRDGRNTNYKGGAVPIAPQHGIILPFRYAEVFSAPFTVTRENVRMVRVTYPMDMAASSFTCDDARLVKIYDLCKYSMLATSFAGVYVDGDRERIPYEADAYINQLGEYAVHADGSLARHSHEYLMDHPTWPTEWKQHSIKMAWADWMWTGDARSIAKCYDRLKNVKLLDGFRDPASGLLETGKRSRDIVDWPIGERDGYVFKPVNTVVNAFHYRNLLEMADLALALGKTDEAQTFATRAKGVYAAFQAAFFDAKRGVYVDGKGTDHASLHANAAALAFGLVPREHVKRVADFCVARGMACSVYFAQYLLEALFEAGRADAAFALMTSDSDRGWLNMLEMGATITLEAWAVKYKPNLDLNHAWGAAPLNIISRYVLGVTPLEPGFAKARIAPQVGPLKRFDARVPTVRGAIALKLVNGVLTVETPVPARVTWGGKTRDVPAGRHVF